MLQTNISFFKRKKKNRKQKCGRSNLTVAQVIVQLFLTAFTCTQKQTQQILLNNLTLCFSNAQIKYSIYAVPVSVMAISGNQKHEEQARESHFR